MRFIPYSSRTSIGRVGDKEKSMLKAGVVRALGAMSGTSLDGVDAAIVETDGHSIMGFGETRYRPYSEAERATLRAALLTLAQDRERLVQLSLGIQPVRTIAAHVDEIEALYRRAVYGH